jgi:hypothetical protein
MSPAGPGLAAARRAEAAAYEKLITGLRDLNGEVLAVAAGLSHGTIETVLAKSDLRPGAEAPLGGRAPSADRQARGRKGSLWQLSPLRAERRPRPCP